MTSQRVLLTANLLYKENGSAVSGYWIGIGRDLDKLCTGIDSRELIDSRNVRELLWFRMYWRQSLFHVYSRR